MSYNEARILEFLPWAQRFARSCAAKLPSYLDREDLQSAGVLGFLRAAARYDANKGASFHGFCAVRIRGAVLDELRGGTGRLGRYTKTLVVLHVLRPHSSINWAVSPPQRSWRMPCRWK
jgi:DNA-directed RNA polymerase specialized sigma subunit